MNNMRQEVEDTLKEENPNAIFFDGFDEAIVGIARRFNLVVVAYNELACIEILMKKQNLNIDEAWEFFGHNIQGAWMGDHTPVLIS